MQTIAERIDEMKQAVFPTYVYLGAEEYAELKELNPEGLVTAPDGELILYNDLIVLPVKTGRHLNIG